jgi:hypothetical protein
MSRVECIREALRLALETLVEIPEEQRPQSWSLWWERYVQTTLDFKTDDRTLQEKMIQSGQDARAVLAWVEPMGESLAQLKSVSLLRRVYAENFLERDGQPEPTRAQGPGAVHNPHDPDAQWSAKGTLPGKSKEWVGYKAQIAETVPTKEPNTRAPTDAVITAVLTQPAITSDHGSIKQVEGEWEREGLAQPTELYVDGGYTSGEVLAKAAEEKRHIHGPIKASPKRGDRYRVEDFSVDIQQRKAQCPAGRTSTNCSRLEEVTGKVNYRFEWKKPLCQSCPFLDRCVGDNQSHRTLLVGEYHEHTQARRLEMKTAEFQERMHARNGVEGTISELKRGYGLRRSRYRGFMKTTLQNYLIGAACNLKRWARRMAWESQIAPPWGVRAP